MRGCPSEERDERDQQNRRHNEQMIMEEDIAEKLDRIITLLERLTERLVGQ